VQIPQETLNRDFYLQPTVAAAQDILGSLLVHEQRDGRTLAGIITEAEAYCGETDLGCHAKAGLTARTEPLYGPPGHAYVYFTYGMHWLFNCVTQPEGEPQAVLVRAIEPIAGLDLIATRRSSQPRKSWTDGPGKLAQALGIDAAHNRLDLCGPTAIISVRPGLSIPDARVRSGPRVGLFTVPEPWKSKPWRFLASLTEEEIATWRQDELT
jgi:DNA-3-methyladenine glycosylase